MKALVYLLLFLTVFGVSFYFFTANSDQQIQVHLYRGVSTPPLPAGMVLLIAFYLGFVAGFLFFPLTYIIKKLS
jgi:uncharacterized membrane protein YciS (DUF1049 family)